MQVNQAVCHLKCHGTLYQSSKDCNISEWIGADLIKLLLWWAHESIQHPQLPSHFWHPWVGLKQCGRIPKVWFSSRSCGGLPLNCLKSLKLPYLVVHEGWWLPFPRSEVSPHLERSPLVANKWISNHHGQDMVSANPVVSLFLLRAFAPELGELIWSFSSWPLLLCQWPPYPVT